MQAGRGKEERCREGPALGGTLSQQGCTWWAPPPVHEHTNSTYPLPHTCNPLPPVLCCTQVLKFLQDLHIESDVTTKECGCLGSCGKGPNMVLLPQERFLAHVATPADAAQVSSGVGARRSCSPGNGAALAPAPMAWSASCAL